LHTRRVDYSACYHVVISVRIEQLTNMPTNGECQLRLALRTQHSDEMEWGREAPGCYIQRYIGHFALIHTIYYIVRLSCSWKSNTQLYFTIQMVARKTFKKLECCIASNCMMGFADFCANTCSNVLLQLRARWIYLGLVHPLNLSVSLLIQYGVADDALERTVTNVFG